MQEGRVRKLRVGEAGAVYGVSARIECACGVAFYRTLTVGVDHPVVWCPRCRGRSRLRLVWEIRGALKEGAVVRWHLRPQ